MRIEARQMLTLVPCLITAAVFSWWTAQTLKTEAVYQLFRSPVSYAQIEQQPHQDYCGLKAAPGIPLLTSAKQDVRAQQLYSGYFVAAPQEIIPMDFYRLKDTGNTAVTYRMARRPMKAKDLPVYTNSPDANNRHRYNRYYMFKFADDSYLAAFVDDYYAERFISGSKTTFPIGRVISTIASEKRAITAYRQANQVDEKKILLMVSQQHYKDVEVADQAMRLAAGILLFGCLAALAAYAFYKFHL